MGLGVNMKFIFLSFNSFLFIYLTEEEGERAGGGAEREGERESQAGSTLSAQSPTLGLISQTVRL